MLCNFQVAAGVSFCGFVHDSSIVVHEQQTPGRYNGAMAVQSLPWTLRESLVNELRSTLVEYGRSPAAAAVLAGVIIRWFAEEGRIAAPLTRGVTKAIGGEPELEETLENWLAEAPTTHRAGWLADRLAAAVSVQWDAQPAAPEGEITLPHKARAPLVRRLEQRLDHTCDRDPPDADEWGDLVDAALARLGHKYPVLAHRLLTAEFPDADVPKLKLPFTKHLRHHLNGHPQLSPEQIIRFVERALQIRWIERPRKTTGSGPARR
jgi:hypothetical protein